MLVTEGLEQDARRFAVEVVDVVVVSVAVVVADVSDDVLLSFSVEDKRDTHSKYLLRNKKKIVIPSFNAFGVLDAAPSPNSSAGLDGSGV
jgi:hypothetical protein